MHLPLLLLLARHDYVAELPPVAEIIDMGMGVLPAAD
jgi:hypothetical protein